MSQKSDKFLNICREKWEVIDMSISKARVQNVIAAEVKKQSYNHEKWIGGQI